MKILTIVLGIFTLNTSIFANSEKEIPGASEIHDKSTKKNPYLSIPSSSDSPFYTKNYTTPFLSNFPGAYSQPKQVIYPKNISFVPPVYQQMMSNQSFPYGQYPAAYIAEQEPKKRNNLFWFINGLMIITPLIGLGVGYWRKEFSSDIREEPIALITSLSFSGVLGLVQAAINSVSYL